MEPRVLTFPPPKTSTGPVFLIIFDLSTRCFERHRLYPESIVQLERDGRTKRRR
uniref:Uncharacterized protein n=1 Tax=Lepeophtheirus salmonis TaxID=72036 RepID=A0A0K2UFV2_LEPSM